MGERCLERLKLSKTVAAAIAASYQAKHAYDDATSNNCAGELVAALRETRLFERTARNAFAKHVNTHGCKFGSSLELVPKNLVEGVQKAGE